LFGAADGTTRTKGDGRRPDIIDKYITVDFSNGVRAMPTF
jgi:hypothetical protein